jgi:hypothetical protein
MRENKGIKETECNSMYGPLRYVLACVNYKTSPNHQLKDFQPYVHRKLAVPTFELHYYHFKSVIFIQQL